MSSLFIRPLGVVPPGFIAFDSSDLVPVPTVPCVRRFWTPWLTVPPSQEYLDLGLPSPPDSGDSSHDVSVDSQFELCKSTAM